MGCSPPPPGEVVVYTALDQEFSEPIFEAFTRRTGVEVKPKYDTESTKTLNLVSAILAESERPRCDLFWNNELLHTLRLERQGALRAYQSPTTAAYPAEYRSAEGEWCGFAARARVLLVNTQLLAEARWPDSIEDLTDPQWRDRCGIAKPLFGTTATHAACLYQAWGKERATRFFEDVQRNCRVMSGNRQVSKAVASGQLLFGLTDTDDAMLEVEAGSPVKIVYPDQGADQEGEELGALFIPNSLCLIKGSPNPAAAEQLMEFLLSPMVEGRLVDGPGAQIPLNPATEAKPRVETPDSVRAMPADFAEAAAGWDAAAEELKRIFATAG
ncbi:extracellular solute-binding protein [Pseudobythopirellula maris]|uniref:extracellular solute-binding protein n=1 Tax=Pseudobythopirellula maris TaxID=2527991 RepID=UPI0018D479C3|nr:extracellular solute-binding protein [Pseudobythopirellula maris]